jgi:signal transduction histidine kinase
LSFSCNFNNLDLVCYAFKGVNHIQISITDITELNELRDVEQRTKLIDSFLMIGSHELKTPLNGILGISSLLITEEADQEKKELLEMIISAAQTLDSVVLKMLRQIYSYKIDDVITAVVDVNVGQVIQKSLPIFNNCLRGRNFVMDNIHLHDTLTVRLPEGHLNDILLEIAINLQRNTPPNGDVFIKTFDQDNIVHIVVENQGMGIPDEDLEKVFEPFYLHQESMNHSSGYEYGKSGMGIGLTILKRNVEQAGGKVWFKNKYKYEKGKENCVILNIELPVN